MALSAAERSILRSIKIGSENDPRKPEFPPDKPQFPASRTYKIAVPGFTDVWLKDESSNPTGTHKDRMAWEIVVTYRDFLLAKERGQITGSLPHMSIISSGSAALAIQAMLLRYRLPGLKVLVHADLSDRIKESLRVAGCELYETDLNNKPLSWKEILSLTHNEGGFDITSSSALDPSTRFYDWLSYEILNSAPDYVFVPFGTGNLYENILNVAKRELTAQKHDPRFKGKQLAIGKTHFLGATTNNPRSRAEKLYSPHLPFVRYDEQWIRLYRYAGYCGALSDVYLLQEHFLDEAMTLVRDQNLPCEPSGAAGLALLLQMRAKIPKNAKILIVNTGKTKYPASTH